MHTEYQSNIIKQLRDQQVRFAPREKKLEQANRAEKLLAEIEPQKTYSYEYVCFRITDYRPDAAVDNTLSGQEASHDLRLFVEDVSDSASVRVEDVPEPVRTVDELSKMFNVSTKTISRWRQQGLVSRRFVFGGRKRVGFLQSSVDRFVTGNRERVLRGERFSQLIEMPLRRIPVGKPFKNDFANRSAGCEVRLLLEIVDCRPASSGDLPAVGFFQPGENSTQGALPGSIVSNEPNLLAASNRQSDVFEERSIGDDLAKLSDVEDGHGRGMSRKSADSACERRAGRSRTPRTFEISPLPGF